MGVYKSAPTLEFFKALNLSSFWFYDPVRARDLWYFFKWNISFSAVNMPQLLLKFPEKEMKAEKRTSFQMFLVIKQ